MTIQIVLPDDGKSWNIGSQITCKIPGASTADEYTVLEVILETGQGSPVHVHRRESETIYVAEGECTVGDDKQNNRVPAGSVVEFKKGIPHFFRNDGSTRTKLIITAIPGGLDRYFEEINSALQEEKTGDIDAINKKYEIEFIEN